MLNVHAWQRKEESKEKAWEGRWEYLSFSLSLRNFSLHALELEALQDSDLTLHQEMK